MPSNATLVPRFPWNEPPTCELYRPPTSARPVNPGVRVTRFVDVLRAHRAAWESVSSVTAVCRRTFWTSTTGVAPVTVIVSSMPPTDIAESMFAVTPVDSSIASRMTVCEARKGERDRVDARPQVDDRVEALAVRDGDPFAFDEGGAGGGDGHARQHAEGIVP